MAKQRNSKRANKSAAKSKKQKERQARNQGLQLTPERDQSYSQNVNSEETVMLEAPSYNEVSIMGRPDEYILSVLKDYAGHFTQNSAMTGEVSKIINHILIRIFSDQPHISKLWCQIEIPAEFT